MEHDILTNDKEEVWRKLSTPPVAPEMEHDLAFWRERLMKGLRLPARYVKDVS